LYNCSQFMYTASEILLSRMRERVRDTKYVLVYKIETLLH